MSAIRSFLADLVDFEHVSKLGPEEVNRRARHLLDALDGFGEDSIATHNEVNQAAFRQGLETQTKAVGELLKAIQDAGGWSVFNPEHQLPIGNAFKALQVSYYQSTHTLLLAANGE